MLIVEMSYTKFEDTEVWKDAIQLAKAVYLLTRGFPKVETYALTDQIRRASTSVSANIAEGFGRETAKDRLHFLTMAYGSLLETKSFLFLATELDLCAEQPAIINKIESIQKQINAIKRAIRER